MKAKIKNRGYNYNLPKGFHLIHDSIPIEIELGKGKKLKTPTLDSDSFDRVVNDSFLDINSQLLAKEFLNLPILPKKYYFSLLILKIVSDKHFKELKQAHPTKYGNLVRKKEDIDKLDLGCLEEEIVDIKWKNEIEQSIDKYFKSYRYKKPVPILIKYSICGCYDDFIMTDEADVERDYRWYQHSPWIDKDYYKVILNMPIRFRDDLRIYEFLEQLTAKANEYIQRHLFLAQHFLDMWSDFRIIDFLSKSNELDTNSVKKTFNSKINFFRNNPSPENDFYLKNYLDCLNKLEERRIVKRCRWCNAVFDYHEIKEYCSDRCKKSKQNKRAYEKFYASNKKTTQGKARKRMKETREEFKLKEKTERVVAKINRMIASR